MSLSLSIQGPAVPASVELWVIDQMSPQRHQSGQVDPSSQTPRARTNLCLD